MKAEVTADDRFRVGQDVHARQFDGDWVLLDLEHGSYFGLDEIGGRIWAYLADGHTPRQIANLLATEYEVDEQVLLADTVGLIRDLVGRSLVQNVVE